jgi:small acid-soluble spore protein F (minor alpha/beta-type SASP)
MSDETKYELARELGFAHKVKDGDWGNITTREAGSLVKAAIEKAEGQMTAERNERNINRIETPQNQKLNDYLITNDNDMTR